VSDPKASGSTVARSVRPLDVDTWPAFARLAEAINGVWGGCWCMGFHAKVGKGRTSAQNRADKEQRVAESRTQASLVLDRDECLGWCQFGSAEELPETKPSPVREGPHHRARLAYHVLFQVLLGFPWVEPRRPLAPIGLCCLTNGS